MFKNKLPHKRKPTSGIKQTKELYDSNVSYNNKSKLNIN